MVWEDIMSCLYLAWNFLFVFLFVFRVSRERMLIRLQEDRSRRVVDSGDKDVDKARLINANGANGQRPTRQARGVFHNVNFEILTSKLIFYGEIDSSENLSLVNFVLTTSKYAAQAVTPAQASTMIIA